MTLNWKKILTDVVTAGVAVGAVLAALVAIAPSVNLPAQETAWLVAATPVVAAVVAEARRQLTATSAAKKAAPAPPAVPPTAP